MDSLSGRTALLTGASRGLGRYMARALAAEGVALALAARSEERLRAAAGEVEEAGGRAIVVPADLSDRRDVERLATRASEALGGVDVLVNNAGVTETASFHGRNPEAIAAAVEVNLLAPMLLARYLLPGMVERSRGHVVNVASLAGKAGPPFEAVYGGTKAGLIGFTQSLRREYHGTGVSASAICPGFVSGAGMYADAVEETGVEAGRAMGTATPGEVAAAVVRSVRDDDPEVIVNPMPVRPLLALTEAWPRLGEWLGRRLGLFSAFEQRVEGDGSGGRPPDGSGPP